VLNTAASGFRSGLDVEYAFDDGVRVRVAYHHMSNGKVFGQGVNFLRGAYSIEHLLK